MTASCSRAATPASRSTPSSTSAASGLELDDLKALRTWGSKTPGHPELGHTAGVETTTGPLGQGVANAVGMAMAARRERGMLDPDAAGRRVARSTTTSTPSAPTATSRRASAREASLARRHPAARQPHAHLRPQPHLDRGRHRHRASPRTSRPRYEAYGWHVQVVDWTNGGTEYVEDVPALYAAINAAKAVTDQPSLIVLDTIIAWPAPNAQNTEAGPRQRARRRGGRGHQEGAGLRPGADLRGARRRPRPHPRPARARRRVGEPSGTSASPPGPRPRRSRPPCSTGSRTRTLPEGLAEALPTFDGRRQGRGHPLGQRARSSTRSLRCMPELWGGSADLAGSNNTTIEGVPSFLPGLARHR